MTDYIEYELRRIHALDRAYAVDAKYFRENPYALYHLRPVLPDEAPEGAEDEPMVLVLPQQNSLAPWPLARNPMHGRLASAKPWRTAEYGDPKAFDRTYSGEVIELALPQLEDRQRELEYEREPWKRALAKAHA